MRGILRRSSRAATVSEATEFLREAVVGHLGTVGSDGWPYVVPVFFAFTGDAIYIHSALQGHKLENIAHNPRVCLQVEELLALHCPARSPCKATAYYRSAVAYGIARVVESTDEKVAALREITKKYLGSEHPIDDTEACCVIRIDVELVTGKVHTRQGEAG